MRLKYDCESNPKIPFIITWSGVLISIIPNLVSSLLSNDFSFWNFGLWFIAFMSFGVIVTLVYYPTYKSSVKLQNSILEIKNNGKKAKGRITEYSANNYRYSSELYTDCFVYISYFDEFLNKRKFI